MVSSVVYVVFPVLLALGLLRKLREYQWGWCRSKVSLHGKVCIVTGANSGIGKETVRELVRRKARVIMACRDMKSASNVIQDIRRTISTGELIPMELDLASLESVRMFARNVLSNFAKIDVLINNAGVYMPVSEVKRTSDGFEMNFGVNHLGHFLLTSILLRRMKDSAPSRIIVVSSTLHERGIIDFENLNGEIGFSGTGNRFNPGYCNSKLANMYFTIELANRICGTGVDVCAVCPGFTYTGLFRNSTSSFKWYQYILFAPIAFLHMRSASQGAQTILHCVTEDKLQSGKFYRNCELTESKVNFDPAVVLKLWEKSEELLNLKHSVKM